MTSTEIFLRALPVIITICIWIFILGKMKQSQEQNEINIKNIMNDIEKMKIQYLKRATFDKFESNICNKFQELFGELRSNKELLNSFITKSLERELENERKETDKFDKINENISSLRADLSAIGVLARRDSDKH
jgi:hypothetical protein